MSSVDRKFAMWSGSNRKRARSMAGVIARRRFSSRKGFRAYKLRTKSIGLAKYNLHSYIRWATPDTLSINVGASQGNYSKAFALSETINASELTALYDQYQVVGVKLMFKLMNNPDGASTVPNTGASSSGQQANNMYPKLWFSRDYDNISTETVDELRQRNTTKCKVMRPNSMISFYIRPALRNQVYLDGVTTATSPIWKQWLDCSNSTVPYYGCKFAFDCEGINVTNQSYQFRVEYKYYLKFKNAR